MINYKSYSDETHEFVPDNLDEIETIEDEVVEDSSIDDTIIGIVNNREVYIRSGAGRDFDPVTTVKKGAELMVLDAETHLGWYQVMTASGAEGYIMAEFVDVK